MLKSNKLTSYRELKARGFDIPDTRYSYLRFGKVLDEDTFNFCDGLKAEINRHFFLSNREAERCLSRYH